MGGGVPRVQMPGNGGGAPGGGMPPGAGGGGMPPGGGMGGSPGPGGPAPPDMMAQIDPNNPMQMELLQRADSMSEQEGAALLEAVLTNPLATQAIRKLVPELGFILDQAQGAGAGAPAGAGGPMPPTGGMPPQGAPPPGGSGMPPGMPAGGGAPPPELPQRSRLAGI